jgi:hypothetical protein
MPRIKDVRVPLQIMARNGHDGWVVDVFGDGTEALHNVPLHDPLDPAQRSTCRWYLEQYVQRYPFSLDKAREAELLLADYANNLLRQLPLRSLLRPHLRAASYDLNSYSIHIYVYDNGSEAQDHSSDSIHRLFWETLEDSELWDNPRWKVVVQRSMLRLPIDLPYVARLPWPSGSPAGQIACLNILLVIGRDMSQDPSSYEDIDPFLATDVLVKVQRHHQGLRGRSKLNIEIVRPGTLTAFERHLERAEAIHGPGHFHLVHFDMHGKAGKAGPEVDRAGKSGYLYFSNPGSDKTVPIPATKVQAILKKHSVRFAVLNSCESASASFGNNANIASGFVNNGVLGVLGMSFKVDSAAAAIFLENFYQSFLVDGQSFSASAAVGRAALRNDTSRPTRYGLRRAVDDSFVAVAYGPTLELLLAHPNSHTSWHPSLPRLGASRDSGRNNEPVLGRDFDLLRIEKELVREQCLYLYGMAGVGKSSFMAYAASLWKLSNFVDAVIHVDFEQCPILSSEDLSTTLLCQLLSQVSFPEHQARLWFLPASSTRSFDTSSINSILAEILSSINTVIILDGLHASLSHQHCYFIPGALEESNRQEVLHAVSLLFDMARDLERSKKLYLILAGRRSDPPWFAQLSANQNKPPCYELRGLTLPNSIELSHRILQSLGVNTEQWTRMDAACLDAIIDLLQGNPAALQAILPLQKQFNVPWQNFYHYLQSGPFKSVEELQRAGLATSPVAQEIYRLLEVLQPGPRFCLSLASNYWHQTVFMTEIVEMFQSLADDSVKNELRSSSDDAHGWAGAAVGLGIDQGLIDLDKTQTCLLLHPLFTIVGRAIMSKFIPLAEMQRLRTWYCRSFSLVPAMDIGSKFSAVVGVANLLTCVEHCFSGVPLEAWCLGHFVMHAVKCFGRPPTIPESFLRATLLLLFAKFARMDPSADDEWQACLKAFTPILLLFSVASNAFDVGPAAEVKELSKRGLALASLLSGEEEDQVKAIFFLKAGWQMSSCISAFALGEKGTAREIWQTLRSSNSGVQDMIDQQTWTRMKKAYLDFASGNLKNYDDLVQATATLFSTASYIEGLDVLRMAFTFLYMCVDQNESVLFGKEESITSAVPVREYEPKKLPGTASPADLLSSIPVEAWKRVIGFDPRNNPSHPLRNVRARRQDLDRLEAAYEDGDTETAGKMHGKLAIEALESCQFTELEGHLASMRKILEDGGYPDESRHTLEKMETIARAAHISHLTSVTFGTKTLEELKKELGPAPHPRLLESVPQVASAIKAWSEAQREPLRWWEQWHAQRGQNCQWLERVYGNPIEYEVEVALLAEYYRAAMAGDREAALLVLDKLEPLCSESVFAADFQHISPLQDARLESELSCKQVDLLRQWKEAMGRDDFDAADAFLEELSLRVRPGYLVMCIDDCIESCHRLSGRMRLIAITRTLIELGMDDRYENYVEFYRHFVQLINCGKFSRENPTELLDLQCQALGWLMQHAVEDSLWKDGLSFSREFLELTDPYLDEMPSIQNDCLNIQDNCLFQIVVQSLNEAEMKHDSNECLRLLDEMIAFVEKQETTSGRPRTMFIFLGSPRKLGFWKGAYMDNCISCARWIQRKADEACSLGGRGPNHSRRLFRGRCMCQFSCVDGYCFEM